MLITPNPIHRWKTHVGVEGTEMVALKCLDSIEEKVSCGYGKLIKNVLVRESIGTYSLWSYILVTFNRIIKTKEGKLSH